MWCITVWQEVSGGTGLDLSPCHQKVIKASPCRKNVQPSCTEKSTLDQHQPKLRCMLFHSANITQKNMPILLWLWTPLILHQIQIQWLIGKSIYPWTTQFIISNLTGHIQHLVQGPYFSFRTPSFMPSSTKDDPSWPSPSVSDSENFIGPTKSNLLVVTMTI